MTRSKEHLDGITYKVNGIAMSVHRELGKGFHEVLYKDALEIEFREAGIKFEREKAYGVLYKGKILDHKYYADFVVEDSILIEVKAQRNIADGNYKQVINYLAVSKLPLALIYNFGELSLVIKRIVL
jgi:GxxExxY protein